MVVGLTGACVVAQVLTAAGGDQYTLIPGNCGDLGGFRGLGWVGRRRRSGGDVRWRGFW